MELVERHHRGQTQTDRGLRPCRRLAPQHDHIRIRPTQPPDEPSDVLEHHRVPTHIPQSQELLELHQATCVRADRLRRAPKIGEIDEELLDVWDR